MSRLIRGLRKSDGLVRVGLVRRGETDPELFNVRVDVYRILTKMLRANQRYLGFALDSEGLFTFEEVAFMLRFLGAEATGAKIAAGQSAVLWISED